MTVAASAQHVQRGLGCVLSGGWRIVICKRIAAQKIPRGLYMVIQRALLCLLGYAAKGISATARTSLAAFIGICSVAPLQRLLGYTDLYKLRSLGAQSENRR
jgi:hypothetical protein